MDPERRRQSIGLRELAQRAHKDRPHLAARQRLCDYQRPECDLPDRLYRKSSHSDRDNCIEATGVVLCPALPMNGPTPTFRKSSYSTAKGENCVEVASTPTAHIAVRDSMHPDAGHLMFSVSAWAALLGAVKADNA